MKRSFLAPRMYARLATLKLKYNFYDEYECNNELINPLFNLIKLELVLEGRRVRKTECNELHAWASREFTIVRVRCEMQLDWNVELFYLFIFCNEQCDKQVIELQFSHQKYLSSAYDNCSTKYLHKMIVSQDFKFCLIFII